jgi:hypothetical protein
VRPFLLTGATLFAVALAGPSAAQQDQPPSVAQILARLQTNISSYLSTVPSFFCDEHVDSAVEQAGYDGKVFTATDSIFRIRRTGEGDATKLVESREIKAVNKKRPKGDNITGPAIFRGAFTNGVRIVSPDFAPCYSFDRVDDEKVGDTMAIVLSFSPPTESLLQRICPEIRHGKVFIDPATFHLLRIEARIPDHEITPGVFGLWTWSINYAPVVLEGRTFWMPKTIESEAIPTDRHAAWSFVAHYRNYHKLEVTSHIVTDLNSLPAAPPQ